MDFHTYHMSAERISCKQEVSWSENFSFFKFSMLGIRSQEKGFLWWEQWVRRLFIYEL